MERTEVSKSLNLVWHPHPISAVSDRQVQAFVFTPGLNVRQLLLKSGIDPIQPIYVVLDDKLLTVAEWDTVYPTEGQILNVQATIQGGGDGGGGSNAGQIIAMVAVIAIAIAAPYLAPAAWGTIGAAGGLTLTGSLLTAGIMIAGSLIVGAIFQPKTNTGLSEVSSTSAESPTYSLSGGSNRLRPYESMPVIMGHHRFFPDYAAKYYTEYQAEDQFLYQIFHLGVSSIYYDNFKIGTTPIENYNNWSFRYTQENGKIYDFPGNVDTVAGAALTKAGGAVTRTTSADTYKIGLDIESVLYYANNSGGMDSRSVELKIEYRPTGTYEWLTPAQITSSSSKYVTGSYVTETYQEDEGHYEGDEYNSYWVENIVTKSRTVWRAGSGGTVIINGNSSKAIRSTLSFQVAQGEYDVRITRVTNDSTDSREGRTTNWSVLKSYQYDGATYKGQNRLGLVIKATEQLNGAIQQLSCDASARAYYYNGTDWTFGFTSNPAHWFMDFAIGRRDVDGNLLYGIGMSPSQLDLGALHTWASFCNTEGLTFNAVIDGSQTAADLLASIARCGFGSPSWASGKLGIVYDARQASPVAAFGMSNIIKDTFAVTYITEELADEIVVRYVDPDKEWNQSEVRVNVPGVTNPIRTSTIDVFGCTDVDMAGKFANYLAAQQYYRRRRISWETDFQGFVCNRGDVVLLSHDLTQWAYSGRIVSVDGDQVSLDRHVPRNGTTEYLLLVKPDGSTVTYDVESAVEDQDVLTLTTPIELQDGYLPMDHMWFFSPLATPGKKVKILSVSPASETRVRITATDEYDEFYDAWDGTFVIPETDTLLPQATPAVTNLALSSRIAVVSNYRVNRVTANWNTTGSVSFCKVNVFVDGNLVIQQAENLTNSVEVDVPSAATVLVQVVPVGVTGVGTTVSATLEVGLLNAPQAPESMSLSYGEDGKSATFTWPSVVGAQSYVIEIVVGGVVKRNINIGNRLSYDYTIDLATVDGGPFRSYTARVYTVANGIQSEDYSSAAFSNAQIGQLVNARIEPMPNSLWFQCEKPTDADWAGIQIWLSKNTSFTPDSATLVYDGTDTWVNIAADNEGNPLESATVYYVYAAGYDSFGKDSLTLTAKLSATVLSPAWGLVQGDIDESVLSLGLNERIDLIDTSGPSDLPFGLITKVRTQEVDINVLDTSLQTISDTLLDTVTNLNQYQEEVYEAGLTIDPETGTAYIYGIQENSDRIDAAEIRLDGAEAAITLRATTAYVDEAIATAVIDPSQIAELEDIYARIATAEVDINGLEASVALKADATIVSSQGARLTTAESDISALEGSVATKVETVVFDQLGARVTVTEQQIEALDVAEITQSVQQIRYIEDNQEIEAETLLRTILQGEKNYQDSDTQIAYASTNLRAFVDEGIAAEASARLELAADLGDTQAALEEEKIVRATADSAEASAREALAARVTDTETGLATASAAITTEASTRATADTALASQITTLSSTVTTNNNTLTAAIQSEATTRATNDTALSNTISTVQTTVNGHTTSIATNTSSINGIEGKYAVKVDNNGYVSGFGLISTANNATPFSEFTIIADRFSLAPVATNPDAVDGSPFFVLTSPQVIDGVTIPAGTYMKKAFIHDASITTAKIADAQINNAKISALDAGKINTGTLSADRIATGSIDAKIANISAAVITSGTIDSARIGNASITTAKIADAAITLAKIDSAVINSLTVADGSITNAKIADGAITNAKIGDAQISAAKISSLSLIGSNNFNVQTATSGARMEMNNQVIKVFDASGVLRVKLGNLDA